MDSSILANRPDVVAATSTARPTATPPRVSFSDVLSAGASTVVRGADQVATALPGAPLMAVALRGGANASMSLASTIGSPAPTMPGLAPPMAANGFVAASPTVAPEGPSAPATSGLGAVAGTSATDPTGMQGTLAQSQEMNIYYLQLQEQVNQQNRTYSALSDVLKAEHDTVKTAIGNIH